MLGKCLLNRRAAGKTYTTSLECVKFYFGNERLFWIVTSCLESFRKNGTEFLDSEKKNISQRKSKNKNQALFKLCTFSAFRFAENKKITPKKTK